MFDPNGKVIMFAAATTFLCFTFSANYAYVHLFDTNLSVTFGAFH